MHAVVDGRTTRWAGHRQRRRAEFVAAAVNTIQRVGPAATVDQIAAEAGSSRPVLYRQFDDREDLDQAIAEHVATLLVEHLTPQLAVDAGIDAGVRHALTAYLDFIDAHIPLYRFVRSRNSDSAPGAVQRVKDTITHSITALARSLVDLPVGAHSALADTTAIALVGMTDAVITAWLDDPRGLTRGQLVDSLVALALGMIDSATASGRKRVGVR